MATINFLYRSKKEKSILILRLLFRSNNIDKVIGVKTKFEVSKVYWNKYHTQRNPRDIDIRNMQTEVKTELNKIENHILKAFKNEIPLSVDKQWLKNQIETYYNPKVAIKIPKELSAYFNHYTQERKGDLASQTLKNYNVLKNLILKYEKSINRTIKIIEVDIQFANNFKLFCEEQGYAANTITRALNSIKGICVQARYSGVETSYQLEKIKPKNAKVEKIYLTFEELKKVEELNEEKVSESYLNARDWLIISCYTGQRVSDFMRFNKNQIRVEKGKSLIEFTQKKTGKIMTVPLHSKVLEILKNRNGDFPREISSQKYNDYIKKLCEAAGINEKVKGSKLVKIENDDNFPYRKEPGVFEKWELVTSHIGRRSFATNFYGEIPTTYLIYVTGHSTESMFLNYIGKSNKDLAIELTKYF